MSRVYESLKDRVTETLQRGKPNSVPVARVKGNGAVTLNNEMEELERIVLERLGRLRSAVKEGEAEVSGEIEQAEQMTETLRENIATLESKLKEAEDSIRRKDSANQKMEESLTSKIHDLQSDLKKKEDALDSRATEITDLKSKIDGQVKQVAQLETAIRQAKTEAATEAKRVEHLTETSKAKIGVMEGMLKETEEVLHKRETNIKTLERDLAAKIETFENQLKKRDELLTGKEAEIRDLKSQMHVLTRGIKEMSSFFKQAEALSEVQPPNGTVTAAIEPLISEPLNGNGVEEKHAVFEPEAPATAPSAIDVSGPTVPTNFFDRVTVELTQAVGPMAAMIVRDHVAALGESIEKFPQARVRELLDTVSQEIADERQKIGFRVRVGDQL